MPKQKHPKPVLIDWMDHAGMTHGGWLDAAKLDNKPCRIRSVGWVVKEDRKYVTIASCYDIDYEKFSALKNVSIIVKSCIVHRKELNV